MSGGSILGMSIVVLLGAVVLGALVVTLVATFVRWRDRIRQPCCGNCRYPVEGLSTFTCPECGADLRGVGILAPGMRPKHRIFIAEMFAAWAVVAVFCGLITAGVVGNSSIGQRMSFSRNDVLTSVSDPRFSVSVSISGTAMSSVPAASAPAHRVVIKQAQVAVSSPLLLDVDLQSKRWTIRPGTASAMGGTPVEGAMPLTDSVVQGWAKSAGLPSNASAASEIRVLTECLNSGGQLSDSSVLQSSGGGMGATYAPASWVIAGSAGLWTFIFAIGSLLIAKAHSTKKRRLPPKQTTVPA